MKEYFNEQNKIFDELYDKYYFKYPFCHSLDYCYDLSINELYKLMVCLHGTYGLNTSTHGWISVAGGYFYIQIMR